MDTYGDLTTGSITHRNVHRTHCASETPPRSSVETDTRTLKRVDGPGLSQGSDFPTRCGEQGVGVGVGLVSSFLKGRAPPRPFVAPSETPHTPR